MNALKGLGALVALIAATVGLLLTIGVIRIVPDVTAQQFADANNRLVAAGFQTQESKEPSDTLSDGLVIRTDPTANSPALKGSNVTIYVSTGKRFTRARVIASGKDVDFPSGQCLNLDTGQEYCGGDYDIVTPLGNEFIDPASGAKLAPMGVMAQRQFDALYVDALLKLTYSTDPVLHAVVNQAIAVKTSRANYSKVYVVRAGQDKLLTFITYELY